MPTLTELENRYLDAVPDDPTDPYPANQVYSSGRSHAIPLIDGDAYFKRLHAVMERTTGPGDAIYIVGWAFPWPDLIIDGPPRPDGVELRELLARKAEAGVDVRLIFWAEAAVSGWGEKGVWNGWGVPFFKKGELVQTMQSALDLRLYSRPGQAPRPLYNRVLLDWSGTTTPTTRIGSHHQKSVVVVAPSEADPNRREIFGFTGGIDLISYAWADRKHIRNNWHDVAVEVRGEAAVAVHENFRLRWSEAAALPDTETVWRVVEGDILPTSFKMIPENLPPKVDVFQELIPDVLDSSGNALTAATETSVQVVQTFQEWSGWDSFRLHDGRDHVLRTLRKAIAAAKRYVYIEDQYVGALEPGFTLDRLPLIEEARVGLPTLDEPASMLSNLLQNPDIKVIMVGGHKATWKNIPKELKIPEFKDRLAVWRLDGRKKGKKVIDGEEHEVEVEPIVMHSKVVIIDDEFAMIGSANFADRSLKVGHRWGTDTEIATALVTTGNWVRDLRVELWKDHLGTNLNSTDADLQNLDVALGMWRTHWRTAPAASLPFAFEIQQRAANEHDPNNLNPPRILLNYVREPGDIA